MRFPTECALCSIESYGGVINMPNPPLIEEIMHQSTRQLIATLDCQWHEYFSERAGILEFDGKIPREEAEQLAWMETAAAMLKHKRSNDERI